MLRWFILIPFAISLSVLTGLIALLFLTGLVPDMGEALVGAVFTAFQALFDAAVNGEDMARAAAMAGRAGLMAAAILVAPVAIMAISSELFRWRGWVVQAATTALLTIAFPLALLAPKRLLSATETRIIIALGLVGIISGTTYWLVAGRGAGRKSQKVISPAS